MGKIILKCAMRAKNKKSKTECTIKNKKRTAYTRFIMNVKSASWPVLAGLLFQSLK